MAWTDPTTPNQTDYTSFLYGVVGIPTANLPASDPMIATTLKIALEIVNAILNMGSATLYTLAVYNLGADRLINFANDIDGQSYFKDLRKELRILDVRVGVPSAANDAGTAVSILNPEQLKTLTLADLQTLKTPYGRQYMGIAQDFGPTIWGLS